MEELIEWNAQSLCMLSIQFLRILSAETNAVSFSLVIM